jgi:hypothetical protein
MATQKLGANWLVKLSSVKIRICIANSSNFLFYDHCSNATGIIFLINYIIIEI